MSLVWPGAEFSITQQSPYRGGVGWDASTRCADSTWCLRFVGILHQQKLQNPFKEKTIGAYSCKQKVQVCVACPALRKHPAPYSAIRTLWIFSSSESHDTFLKPPQVQIKLNHKSKPLEEINPFICKRGKIIKHISSMTFPSALTFIIEQNNKIYSSLVFPLRIQSKQLIVNLSTSLYRKEYFSLFWRNWTIFLVVSTKPW